MEGFAQELAPLGVRSLLVEPGMLRTDFMDRKSASFGSIDIPDYAEAIAQSGSEPARRSTNCGRRSPILPIPADTTDQGAGKGR